MDFSHSQQTQDYLKRIQAFMAEHIAPWETERHAELAGSKNAGDWTQWQVLPGLEDLKAKAREAGLWNLFLPDVSGLSNLEYAPLAEQMGRSFFAPEIFNCSAPDTGNMEVLHKFGSEEQKAQWLQPLLNGDIRSVFFMTEPDVASSDATNMQATAIVQGDEVVLNGKKWWSSGVGDPRCKVGIFMALTDAEGPRHAQHSMVLVPMDTAGVEIKRMLPVFGFFDEPHGHGEVWFDNVRVPASNIIGGPGMGFAIAQGRLGPGRIHHCMRAIGAAEVALERLIKRGAERNAFGKPLLNLGGNRERIANHRMAIDQARLLTLYTAWKIDNAGVMSAMTEISAIKVVAANMLQAVVDDAIQIHGGAGVSSDTPLSGLYMMARALRLADGPDEVHRGMVARMELSKYGHK
ncbi:MAG: acyl-CoA dehydrogenase family protein [Nevskiales bacterium]